MFNWTPEDLHKEYEAAKQNGWLPFFQLASQASGFGPEQLLALASRESGSLWSKHQDGNILGDNGHAFGIMQINNVTHHDLVDSFRTDPEQNIRDGAGILTTYRHVLRNKWLLVYGPNSLQDQVDVAVYNKMLYAAYNRGPGGVWESWLEHQDPDAVTANHNYGQDCVAREPVFRQFLQEEQDGK